jgi:hypothetical protein
MALSNKPNFLDMCMSREFPQQQQRLDADEQKVFEPSSAAPVCHIRKERFFGVREKLLQIIILRHYSKDKKKSRAAGLGPENSANSALRFQKIMHLKPKTPCAVLSILVRFN